MVDVSWLAGQAKTIHDAFVTIFYSLATVLLVLGVIIEYFKLPVGGSGMITQLVGRVLIAAILLHSYPEISNLIAEFTDALSAQLGDMNKFSIVLSKYADQLHHLSFSWTSLKDSAIMLISFLLFFLLYLSVYLADAGIIFGWTILYTFSPILIAMYILPVTAPATSALFRSLFEISAWKIVWTVLATLLWSYGLSSINKPQADINFLTVLALNFILAASLLLTPKVVHALTTMGVAGFASEVGGVGAAASLLNPGIRAAAVAKGVQSKVQNSVKGAVIGGYKGLKDKYFSTPAKGKAAGVSNLTMPKPPSVWLKNSPPNWHEPSPAIQAKLDKE